MMLLIDVPSMSFFLSVFNDGNKMDLLNLEGTVPVNYKGEFMLPSVQLVTVSCISHYSGH